MVYGAEISDYKTLAEIADAAGIEPADYNWLISEWDVFVREGESVFKNKEYVWFTGEEFAEMIKCGRYHFIWCMASAFPRTVSLDDVLKYRLPYADGNGGFWVDDVKLQTPLSRIELVIFDGSSCFVLSDDVRHRDNFLSAFSDAFDIVEDNRINNARADVIRGVIRDSDIAGRTDKPEWKIYHEIFDGICVPEDMKEICERCRAALGERGLLAKKKGDGCR